MSAQLDKIFIVSKFEPHESSCPLKAFARREDAQAMVDRIRAYVERAPTIDYDLGNSDEELEEWSRQEARQRRYLARCPDDPEAHIGEEYSIDEVPFTAAPTEDDR